MFQSCLKSRLPLPGARWRCSPPAEIICLTVGAKNIRPAGYPSKNILGASSKNILGTGPEQRNKKKQERKKQTKTTKQKKKPRNNKNNLP